MPTYFALAYWFPPMLTLANEHGELPLEFKNALKYTLPVPTCGAKLVSTGVVNCATVLLWALVLFDATQAEPL